MLREGRTGPAPVAEMVTPLTLLKAAGKVTSVGCRPRVRGTFNGVPALPSPSRPLAPIRDTAEAQTGSSQSPCCYDNVIQRHTNMH